MVNTLVKSDWYRALDLRRLNWNEKRERENEICSAEMIKRPC